MRELFSLKTIALAAAFVAAFALAGLGAARLMPAPAYATATVAAIGGLPAEGELEGIAKDVDANLADQGLPARVTATRTQISVLIPPSSKDPAEVQAIIARSLEKLPVLGVPPSDTPYAADRLNANIEKIRKAEEVVARQAERLPATGTDAAAFDFNSYAEAVVTLAAESDRLAAIAEAYDPELRTLKWDEPRIAMQTQRVSGVAMAALGGAFGLLLFCIVLLIGAAARARANGARA